MHRGGGDNGEASNPDSRNDRARRAGGRDNTGRCRRFCTARASAWGEGTSYAGVAAGGSLSAMFWNPATITQSGKLGVELSTSVLFPEASQVGSLTFLNPPLSALSPFGFTD